MSTEQSASDREELIRLRAEVAALRAAQESSTGTATRPGAGWTSRLRTIGATILIILGSILAPLSVVATWLDTQVTDTDAYVETVGPLIEDPALQQALSRTITARVFEELDVPGVTQTALESLTARTDLPPRVEDRITGLAVPMTEGVQTFLQDQVLRVVSSDRFATVWAEANRAVHAQLVATLTGQTREGVEITDGQVALDIAPFVEVVKERLVDRGIGVAARIPEVHTSFVLFELPNLPAAQRAFAVLNALGAALPFVALAVLASGILLARGRRRAAIGAGLGVAAGMLLLGTAVLIAREVYLGSIPPDLLPRETAAAAFDTVVRFLRTSMRAVFVLALVLATAAYLTGPSVAATTLRRGIASGFDGLRAATGRPGGLAGERVGHALASYRRPLRIGVIALGAFIVIVMDRPSPAVIVTVLLLVLLALVVIEVLAAPAPATADQDEAPATATRSGGGRDPDAVPAPSTPTRDSGAAGPPT
ncbi:hypothetical protein [Citricoccus sp.]|uniref:hypothetical protein n=1 Tax=Citricoccus sp. TaxID=1978372 RepID=UPI002BC143AB|nr:hypothetical protein [Citricoccus sp.]HRO92332.1 hypothetical protein [Citricoccus sp.]